MSVPDEVWYGIGGGALAELLGWWKLRQTAPVNLPAYLKSPFYWIMTVLMSLAGGVVAFVYAKSGISLSPILALNVGASAPLIIGNLTAKTPDVH